MSDAAGLRSGKGHRDENFPVASFLIAPRHRPAVLAFYNFVRTADDVADHATAPAEEKLRLLDTMRASLVGENDLSPQGVVLREVLRQRRLRDVHALDLLEAFRRDVTRKRYADWDDLMDYCRYSAMPVGRFMLEVHGETEAAWPANDALCAALQLINHLQDCGNDFRDLDRVYLPADTLAGAGARVEDLAATAATPQLRVAIADLAARTMALLDISERFAAEIADFRLGLDVAIIQRLARDLTRRLIAADPLSDRVHHGKAEAAGLALAAAIGYLRRRGSGRGRHG